MCNICLIEHTDGANAQKETSVAGIIVRRLALAHRLRNRSGLSVRDRRLLPRASDMSITLMSPIANYRRKLTTNQLLASANYALSFSAQTEQNTTPNTAHTHFWVL